jgi:hypothetical protein
MGAFQRHTVTSPRTLSVPGLSSCRTSIALRTSTHRLPSAALRVADTLELVVPFESHLVESFSVNLVCNAVASMISRLCNFSKVVSFPFHRTDC